MSTLIIDHRDISLDYEADCLLIRHPAQPMRSVPLTRLQRVLVMHSAQVTTRLIGHLQQRGIDFIVINGRFSELSFSVPANHQQQAQRRVQQYRLASNPALCLPLARQLIVHKLVVTQCMLRRRGITAADNNVVKLQEYSRQIAGSEQMNVLRGHEGSAQRLMFSYWRSLLPAELNFGSRQRRPPPDPVNALLSLSFTLAYHESTRQCLIHGLDAWLGIYHQLSPGRFSLACDLMEPLRPLIEAWVVDLFLSGELDRRHFSQNRQGCLLGKQGRELYYALWHRQAPLWGRRMGHYARILARHLNNMSPSADTLDIQ